MNHAINPEWWKNYFSANYGTLYRGALAEFLQTDLEVVTLQRIFVKQKGLVLDAGCGHGRHLVPLRKQGVKVVGLDYSLPLLQQVAKGAQAHLLRGDLRQLPLTTDSLSGAYLLFNTFGYFSDGENLAVLTELARVLKPGAPLVMDLPSRAGMRKRVTDVPASISYQGNVAIQEAWSFEEEGSRLNCKGTWSLKGSKQEWELSLRVYTPLELERLLRKAGFAGALEVRPTDDLDELGTVSVAPEYKASVWKTTTSMTVLAHR